MKLLGHRHKTRRLFPLATRASEGTMYVKWMITNSVVACKDCSFYTKIIFPYSRQLRASNNKLRTTRNGNETAEISSRQKLQINYETT